MTKRRGSIKSNLYPLSLLAGIVVLWQLILMTGVVDSFILPSPLSVVRAFIKDFHLLMAYSLYTLFEGISGLLISILLGYGAAVGMDRFRYMRKALYPLLILSQTVPYIAIAPLLVLWLGYHLAPKIVLVTLTCFFPVAVGVFDGIRNIQKEYMDEFSVLGGTYIEGLVYIKTPMSLPSFFSAVKIASTYALVGAVVAEWIGGTAGLGVYMTRVRKAYEFDKMFAVILLVVIISLGLLQLVKFLERRILEYD